jgi:hypothetical protein
VILSGHHGRNVRTSPLNDISSSPRAGDQEMRPLN